jgi:hypothetical protein
MSQIDKLIADLCPEGVEFRTLASLGEWYGGGTPSKNRAEYWTGGTIPWISPKDMGKRVVDSTINQITEAAVRNSSAKLVPARSIAMVVRSSILDHTFPTALVPVIATLNQDMRAVAPSNEIVPDYLAHILNSRGDEILRTAKKSGGSVASIDSAKLLGFRVPIPPLEVQREITRVLDKFTQLEAELEAELEARRRQYEHYRARVFDFSSSMDVRWSTLGEISTRVSSGATPKAGAPEYYENGNIPWLRTNEVSFREVWDTEVKITEHALKKTGTSWIDKNCVIIAISGATAGRSAINKIPLTTNQHCCNLRIDEKQADYKYIFFWVSSKYSDLKSLGRGARSDLNARLIKSFPVPLPALEEQRRIVSVLDKFDSLVNDLTIGLPAELAARRKQYEYYRDRLLTFEEKR